MSEPTDRAEDFRGARGSKRHDETVVLSADKLAELTNQVTAEAASGTPTPEHPAPVVEPEGDANRQVLLVAAAVITVLVVVLLVVWAVA